MSKLIEHATKLRKVLCMRSEQTTFFLQSRVHFVTSLEIDKKAKTTEALDFPQVLHSEGVELQKAGKSISSNFSRTRYGTIRQYQIKARRE